MGEAITLLNITLSGLSQESAFLRSPFEATIIRRPILSNSISQPYKQGMAGRGPYTLPLFPSSLHERRLSPMRSNYDLSPHNPWNPTRKQPQGKLKQNLKTTRILPKTSKPTKEYKQPRNHSNTKIQTSKNMHGANNKMGKIPYLHKCYGYGGLRRAHYPSFFNFPTSLKVEIGWQTWN